MLSAAIVTSAVNVVVPLRKTLRPYAGRILWQVAPYNPHGLALTPGSRVRASVRLRRRLCENGVSQELGRFSRLGEAENQDYVDV